MEAFGDTLTLPDTKGQWRYVTYAFNDFQGFGDLLYINIKGAGTTVDIDHINVKAGAQLTPPVFTAGNADLQFIYLCRVYSHDQLRFLCNRRGCNGCRYLSD